MQATPDKKSVLDEEEDFSVAGLVSRNIDRAFSILRRPKWLVIGAVFGGALGLAYSVLKPVTYTSKVSFVVEDTKASAGGLMSAISGQLGIDIGGVLGGSGMLAGDNILAIVKSSQLMKKTLLSPYDEGGKQSLADRYIEVYKWRGKWEKNKKIARRVSFPVGAQRFSRQDDSLFKVILKRLDEKEVSIAKPDRKLTVFAMQVTTRDERLSQLLADRLLNETSRFYIETKTHRLRENVARLQKRADSIGLLLNRKTFASGQAEQMLLNANPAFASPTVSAEITARDKVIVGTIYTEIMKNLEISKTALIQETPTVQVIDRTDIPLKKNEVKWYEGLLLGMLVGGTILFLWRFFR